MKAIPPSWVIGPSSFVMAALLLSALASAGPPAPSPPASQPSPTAKTPWVFLDAQSRLAYKTTPAGDRILDFSSAGYMGGGIALPAVEVRQTVPGPNPSDAAADSPAIQAALDAVAKLNPVNGFRGAVLLTPGTYHCQTPLTLRTAGVVLRGGGTGPDATILRMTGIPHTCITITGQNSVKAAGTPIAITDPYVPSGAASFHVAAAAGLSPGDTLLITRPVTKEWIKYMGMDTLVRNDAPQTWLAPGAATHITRTIKAISANQITLDLPLPDSLDAQYLQPAGATIAKAAVVNTTTQIGIENLSIAAPAQNIAITDPQYKALTINGAADCWFKNLHLVDTINSTAVGGTASRITFDHVAIDHTVPTVGAAKPADFSLSGTQVLFNQCSGKGDSLFFFASMTGVPGPNVMLHCTFRGNAGLQPHMRWATGILFDNCRLPEGTIDLMNRGTMGSGHGWAVAWAVAWNCSAKSFLIQQPPGAANWAIGCTGAFDQRPVPGTTAPNAPEGIIDSRNDPVTPASLYLAQLQERLGPQALKNIGY